MRRLHIKKAVGSRELNGNLSREENIFGSLKVLLSEDFTVCPAIQTENQSANQKNKNTTIIVITIT
jgi:hypothetical protein